MGLLLILIQYLVDAGLCIGDGEDCYRDFTPEGPDDVVVLHEYEGDPLSPFTTNAHRSIQIKVRSRNTEIARSKAVSICRAFYTTSEDRKIVFSADMWGQVYVRQTPFKLLQDDEGRVIYCFNLGITTNVLE